MFFWIAEREKETNQSRFAKEVNIFPKISTVRCQKPLNWREILSKDTIHFREPHRWHITSIINLIPICYICFGSKSGNKSLNLPRLTLASITRYLWFSLLIDSRFHNYLKLVQMYYKFEVQIYFISHGLDDNKKIIDIGKYGIT